MNQTVLRAVLAALLLGSVAAAARADASADVQAKIDGAMASAKSFVVVTSYPAQAYASTLVYVAPNRSRLAVAVAASTTDVIVVGDTSYSSKNGAPFDKAPLAPGSANRFTAAGSVKVGSLRPDVTAAGVTYGAFTTTLPLGADVTITCTYDKKTFRLARCENADVTRIYSAYDDPNNTVDVPANIVDTPQGAK
jgi:hypothetical protein